MRPMTHTIRRRPGHLLVAVLFLISLLTASAVFGAPIMPEQARTAVRGWLNLPGRGLGAVLGNAEKETQVFTDAAGAPTYYVVYLQPSGFVIVPADDLVEPIICFSAAGRYDPSANNPLGALVSRDIPGRLALARGGQGPKLPQKATADAQNKWGKLRSAAAAGPTPLGLASVSDPRVDPLVESRWSQGSVAGDYCYNYYTPNHYVCGCVATAMAQVMRFYQYPTTGVGTGSFTIYVNGVAQTANLRGGDGNGGPYDWANMVLVPGGGITEAERQAIGALCYDAGVAVHMQYSSSGSGAWPTDASTALKNVFFYNNSICGGNGSNIGSGLTVMLNPNLDAGYPCLLAIYAPSAGHEIVADGYGYDSSTLYHHLNLGWAGSYDAWYNLPNFSAGGYNWDTVAWCIYNLYVTGSGEIISGRVLEESGSPIAGATVTATRSGGGTYTATTNARGIYAFPKVPSASTFTLSATAPGHTFTDLIATTGTSTDGISLSGNVWGKDFGGPPPLTITTTSLPSGTISVPYSATLAATGGAPPYAWWMLPVETLAAQVAPAGGTAKGWHADDNSWSYTLPFSFPYMGKTYTSVWVCSNGFLDLASSAADYSNSTSGLQGNVRIAPLWDDLRTDGGAQPGEDIYIYQPDGDSVTIRWVAQTYSGAYPANFEVLLRRTGEIEFHYGSGNTGLTPTVGLGSGNPSYYVLSAHDSQSSLTNAQTSLFQSPLHDGLTLDAATGAISGTPTVSGARNVQFVVRDNAGAQADKMLALQINTPILGISVTPATFDFGIMNPGVSKTNEGAPLTVENTGGMAEDIGVRIRVQDDRGEWTVGTPGLNVYGLGTRLSELMGTFTPGDVLTTAVQWCDGTKFGGGGNDMPSGSTENQWFEFHAPTAVDGVHAASQHTITVEVSCRQAE